MFLLNNLVLVAMCAIVFWGTFFPLIAEAVTGTRASVGPPWFDRAIVPAALLLVLLTGIGPVIPWRRATLANLRRQLTLPILAAVAALAVSLVLGADHVPSLILFTLAGFAVAVVVQEYVRGVRARRAMASEIVPVALVSLVRRNRRRYGGYLVHLGVVVLFVGVGASSAFNHQADVTLSPGQSREIGGYTIRYEEPTSRVVAAPNGRLERIDLGARLSVARDGAAVRRLHTQRSYFPSSDPSLGPVSRFFEGESTSEVGLRAGVTRDVWTAVAPSLAALRPRIEKGDEVFSGPGAKLPPEQRGAFLAQALTGLADSYEASPPPATFRMIVSPLVSWIWIGAIVVFLGGLVAIWPAPRSSQRLVTAGYAARLARELGRA
jgi:cytochrome c-type biogenesis protein CcmF